MGKNPAYLPKAAWSVGAMLDDQLHVTWHCNGCESHGQVDLCKIAQAKGIDYCLVDRKTRCRVSGCGGKVYFRYSDGPGTPSRRLEALRERQEAAARAAGDQEMAAAKAAYNAIAKRNRRTPLP